MCALSKIDWEKALIYNRRIKQVKSSHDVTVVVMREYQMDGLVLYCLVEVSYQVSQRVGHVRHV